MDDSIALHQLILLPNINLYYHWTGLQCVSGKYCEEDTQIKVEF